MTLLATEDYLIAQTKAVVLGRARVESLPGDWDDDMLKRLAGFLPGVYVAFSGGERSQAAAAAQARIEGRYVFYVCTGHATEDARRRGTALAIGAYQLLDVLVPFLHGLKVPDVGTLQVLSMGNLFTGSIERQALTVYSVVCGLPMAFDKVPPEAALAPFAEFHAQIDTPPHVEPAQHAAWLVGDYSDSKPEARDLVVLPQP